MPEERISDLDGAVPPLPSLGIVFPADAPVELLPDPWPGSEAYALARALYRLTQAQAERHILAALRREDGAAPDADAAFYQRFGGLA